MQNPSPPHKSSGSFKSAAKMQFGAAQMSPQGPNGPILNIAKLPDRIFAVLIDLCIIIVVSYVVQAFLLDFLYSELDYNTFYDDDTFEGKVHLIKWVFSFLHVSFAIGFAYYIVFEQSKWQATLGKKVFKLKVYGLDGEAPKGWQVFARNFAKMIIVLPAFYFSGDLDFIVYILFVWGGLLYLASKNDSKRIIYDKLFKTLVQRK